MRQIIMLALAAAVGCGRPTPTPTTAPPPQVTVESRFNPATAGTVRGRVTWVGEVPEVSPLTAAIPNGTGFRFTTKPNPFAPRVSDGGLAGALVWLSGVDPASSKPWPFPPATVEQADYELKVRQGDGPPAAVGFARPGDDVSVVSRDPGPATIRLRGAAFITLPFAGPDRPLTHRCQAVGAVEVTSGTMLSWAACDLVVADSPYLGVTDAAGRFELTGVPPGEYTLHCRVRSWRETGYDRDPETGLVTRRRFAPPVELTATLRVTERGAAEHTFTLDAAAFVTSPKR